MGQPETMSTTLNHRQQETTLSVHLRLLAVWSSTDKSKQLEQIPSKDYLERNRQLLHLKTRTGLKTVNFP